MKYMKLTYLLDLSIMRITVPASLERYDIRYRTKLLLLDVRFIAL